MPYFMPLRNKIFFANVPLLVHDILEQGYDTLSSVPGLENLKEAAFRDPEVRTVLANSGLSSSPQWRIS